DDHVLLAVDQSDKALGVNAAHVSGVEPAAAKRLGRRLGQTPVAGEDVPPADDELAHLVGGYVAVVLVDDASLHMKQGPPDRAVLLLDVIGVEERYRRTGLGHAEALLEGHALALEVFEHRKWTRRTAGDGQLERRQVVSLEVG